MHKNKNAQEESDAIKHNAEDFRVCTELTMNEEQIVHQSKILEFNKKLKQFAARKKQFDADEAQRLLHEAEWQQRENIERLKELQCSQQFARQKLATGRVGAPTVPPWPNPPPLPRMGQAAAGQQRSRQKALVMAKEAAYRQLVADPTIDLYEL